MSYIKYAGFPQTPDQTAEKCRIGHVVIVYKVSSRVRMMLALLLSLQVEDIEPLMITAAPPMEADSDTATQVCLEDMVKRWMKEHFDTVEVMAKRREENLIKREIYKKEMEKILARPLPENDYRAAKSIIPMTRAEYLKAERQACECLFMAKTTLSVGVIHHARSQTVLTPIPEPTVLQWLSDIRSDLESRNATQQPMWEGGSRLPPRPSVTFAQGVANEDCKNEKNE